MSTYKDKWERNINYSWVKVIKILNEEKVKGQGPEGKQNFKSLSQSDASRGT